MDVKGLGRCLPGTQQGSAKKQFRRDGYDDGQVTPYNQEQVKSAVLWLHWALIN